MTAGIEMMAVLLTLPLLILLRCKKPALFSWASNSRKESRTLQVVDQVRLTPSHSIHAVRLADRLMVIAVHPSGCQLLSRGRWPAETERRYLAGGEGA
jgi:flagellar biogenesis protein FliO